jgi:hypothetical protein
MASPQSPPPFCLSCSARRLPFVDLERSLAQVGTLLSAERVLSARSVLDELVVRVHMSLGGDEDDDDPLPHSCSCHGHALALIEGSECARAVRSRSSEVEDLLAFSLRPGWHRYKESKGVTVSTLLEEGNPIVVICAEGLVPSPADHLLCVVNEVGMWKRWVPSWSFPIRLGLAHVEKVEVPSRACQLLQVELAIPFPFSNREVLVTARGADCLDELGRLVIALTTADRPDIPARPNTVRALLSGGIFLTPEAGADKTTAKMIVKVDPRLAMIPSTLVNFVAKIAVPMVFSRFCAEVATVKTEPLYRESMARNADLFDMIQARLKLFA